MNIYRGYKKVGMKTIKYENNYAYKLKPTTLNTDRDGTCLELLRHKNHQKSILSKSNSQSPYIYIYCFSDIVVQFWVYMLVLIAFSCLKEIFVTRVQISNALATTAQTNTALSSTF